ncbi:MAG: DNA replication/repair protein RecF [Clostridia bacterium]|nr:DNA replication/repair protein RecF [Clostridia bacterium]
MTAKKIRLKNFRNIQQADVEFSTGVTVLNGENGHGKTNLLEAIYIPARGKSFRTSHENELIRFGEDVCEIELTYLEKWKENKIFLRWLRQPAGARRICLYNKAPVTRLSELVGKFRAVFFCPDNLSLIKDGPAGRRRYLDIAISQTDGGYLRSVQKYSLLLAQRNALIKDAVIKRDENIFLSNAEIWSSQLAEEAEKISARRYEFTEKMSEKVNEIVSELSSGREKVSAGYRTPKKKEEYIRLLTENMHSELRAGMTLYGVHRDDIEINVNSMDARMFCSQGQQRTVALAMKLAEGELACVDGSYPVYLLDDILSELDESRRKIILDGIKNRQVIISSCDRINTESRVYRVKDGKFGI